MSGQEDKIVDEAAEREARPGCFSMLFALFVRPSLAMAVSQVHGLWGAALLFILACLFVGAVGEGAHYYEKYMDVALPIVREVAKNVAPVSVLDGRLTWQMGINGEYSLAKNGWSVDFSQAPEVRPYVAGNPEKGIWVTEKGISLWNVFRGEGNRIIQREILGEKHLQRMEKSLESSDEKELGEKELVNLCLIGCAVSFPLLVFWFFLSHGWSVLFCLLIFCLASLMFRRDMGHSFGSLFKVGVNLCAVPTFATLIWYAVTPPSWTFDNIFYVCFILYILFVYRDTRLFLQGGLRPRRPRGQ
ncbi:MAG: hypothetical protein IKR81_04470 [Victivallales bacterium]|nr:hypothetical protein [Victivallales bacterium]